jgi:hypothetical protein
MVTCSRSRMRAAPAAFRGVFTAPIWDHVLVLIASAVPTPGMRTVSAVLRIMGLSEVDDFDSTTMCSAKHAGNSGLLPANC